MASEQERWATSTRKDIDVLCCQHHTEMLARLLSESAEGMPYVCQEPGCLIRYDILNGYFLDTNDSKTIELEIIPRVNCSNDGQRLYLAVVMPERRSFRLWKCPECNHSCINIGETSGGLEKKMGA